MAPPADFAPIQPTLPSSSISLPSAERHSPFGIRDLRRKPASKRSKSVTQACSACRRTKAKCDGIRPRCGGCEFKGRPCRYEGEDGQSRQEAMRTRLAALEKLVGALQSKSPEEADILLQRIRSADDIVCLSGSDGEGGSTTGPTASWPVLTDVSSPTSFQTSQGRQFGVESAVAPDRPRPNASAYLIRLIIPSAQLTREAIQSFFSSSGKLFQVFSQEQVELYYKSVFGLDGLPNTSQSVAIASLCAVASVGIQYNPGDFEKGAEKTFYDIARHYYVNAVETSPLDAVKLCSMLAMFNVLDKATVALAYVEVGMGLSQRWETSTSSYLLPLEHPDWEEYRRTRRALMFFSTWLSSTLGYISGNGDSTFDKLVPLANPNQDDRTEISEIVQVEMAKISLLTAEILRMHLAFRELTSLALGAVQKSLQEWHRQLPPQMHLSYLGRQDLSDDVRRTIFYVHLLYLGAFILLYRRVASHVMQSPGASKAGEDCPAWKPCQDALLEQAEKGVTAAKHSARILGLLRAERGVFKRCWVVIFQSHTACVVILHSVAQKQLHNFPPSSWAEDLEQAQLCLDTLEFCGSSDPVALRFHTRLSGIYSNLAGFSGDDPSNMRRTEDWVSMPPDFPPLKGTHRVPESSPTKRRSPEYLLSTPPSANPMMLNLAQSLLLVLCKPWGDPAEREPGMSEGQGQSGDCWPERLRNTEQIAWGTSGGLFFTWDTSGLGLKSDTTVVNRFLGSEWPNGWSPAADMEIYNDDDARPALLSDVSTST